MIFNKFRTKLHRKAGLMFYGKLNPVFNFVIKHFGKSKKIIPASSRVLIEIQERSQIKTDISDHLYALFAAIMSVKPKLIVELGVNTGESTFVLSRAARLCGSTLLSVDINDCSKASDYPSWNFIQSDDVVFAQKFRNWAETKQAPKEIDFLFIDTSHEYGHTVQEIKAWFPFLSPNATVVFHDTHLESSYRRQDGSYGVGWYNERGVIRAIEEYLGGSLNEKKNFVDCVGEWLVTHYSWCNGLTIMQRVGKIN